MHQAPKLVKFAFFFCSAHLQITCLFSTNFMLKQLLTEPSCGTLSNSVVTVHPLALLYIGLYSLNTDMLSTCLLSDVFQIEGCLAGLDVGAMVCMLTQGDGWILKGRTGCVRCATHLGTWKMSSISCLVAQLTVMAFRQKHASLFQQAFTVSDFFTNSEPNACGGFLRECFSLRKSIVST